MSKHRILILSNHFITLYRFRRELIQRLLSDGYDVWLSMPPSEDNQFFEQMGCHIIETRMDRRGVNPIRDIMLLLGYIRIMRQVRPHAVLSYTIKPNIYGSIASRMTGCKQICNITGTGATFMRPGMLKTVAIWLYRLSTPHVYRVFLQNKGDLEFFRKHGLVKGNERLIPGSGVNLQDFTPKPMPGAERTRFLFAGRIMKIKGVEELLSVAQSLEEAGANCSITLAGFIEEECFRSALENLPSGGILEFVGFQKDISKWIEDSHCILLPSHGGEGIPNILLEGAAMERPAIVSAVEGSVEVVLNSLTGFHFEAGSSQELFRAMNSFLQLSHTQQIEMGRRARQYVSKNFDKTLIVETYLSTLRELIEE